MKDAKISSQSALARASGVPQATISRILKGDSKKGPETDTLKKLAAACNVSFDWLNEGRAQTNRGGSSRLALVHTPNTAADEDALLADIIELISAYRAAGRPERKLILKSAKLAAKRATTDSVVSTRD